MITPVEAQPLLISSIAIAYACTPKETKRSQPDTQKSFAHQEYRTRTNGLSHRDFPIIFGNNYLYDNSAALQ